MQSKNELENWYRNEDPWNYMGTQDDIDRLEFILEQLEPYGTFERALDIGAGEGFITTELPAQEIDGYELSDAAAERFPDNVRRVDPPEGKYDLVVATGVLYAQYDHAAMEKLILDHAGKVILTSHIKSWEINTIPKEWLVFECEFPYREYTQHFCIYHVPTTT